MNPSQRDDLQHEYSPISIHQSGHEALGEDDGTESRTCPGCQKSVFTDEGLVIAFGQSFFHVDCFKCAKCGDQVTADTDILILSDGSPICSKCTFICNICREPILDEAMTTGDDAYHAKCFRCKVCQSSIDDLVYAKTSHAIYCMECHNKRIEKIRRHAQRKKERDLAGGSGSSLSREREANNFHRENGAPLSEGRHSSTSSRPSSSRGPDIAAPVRSPTKPTRSYVSDAFAAAPAVRPSTSEGPHRPPLSTYSSSQSFSVTVAPPVEPEQLPKSHPPRFEISPEERPNPVKQSTLPIPNGSVDVDPDGRRRSYDDGVRPLNVLFGRKGDPTQEPPDVPVKSPPVSDGLAVATSRREKRRSINPAASLSDFNSLTGTSPVATVLSPRSASYNGAVLTDRTSTPPTLGGRESPYAVPSPLREHFGPRSPSSSRPTSHSSSHLSQASHRSSSTSLPYSDEHWQNQSQPSSPSHNADDQTQDQTIVVKSLPSVVTVGAVPPPKTRFNGRPLPNTGGPAGDKDRLSASSKDIEALRNQRSFDDRRHPASRPDSGSLSLHSDTRSRSVSPAYRADVPSNVESETDTDIESEHDERSQFRNSVPPAPPPKEEKDLPPRTKDSPPTAADDFDPDASLLSYGSGSEESSPVAHTAQSTFIAPALPPIRISLNTADFTDLFNSVGGFPSGKPQAQLPRILEGNFNGSFTPPPTAALEDNGTPRSNITIIPEKHDITITETEHGQGDDQGAERDELHPKSAPVPPKSAKAPEVFSRPLASNASDSSRAPRLPTSSANSEHSTITETNGSIGTLKEQPKSTARITLTEPGSNVATALRNDNTDLVTLRLQEAVVDARERGAQQLKMDRGFVEAILSTMESRRGEYQQLKSKFDGVKRTSKQYIEGITVAQTEYDRELKARRDAEAEVTRLRVLLSGQVARLTALSGDSRKDELRQQLSKELHENLSGLEQDLSNLKVERDMAMAEVEEISATKSTVAAASPEVPAANLSRSFTKRLDTIKSQYKRELVPLTKEREGLVREIAELKAVRNVFLEETTVLNARNEELAQLSAVYSRRIESRVESRIENVLEAFPGSRSQHQHQQHAISLIPSLSSSTSSSLTVHEDNTNDTRLRVHKAEVEHPTPSKGKFIKWPGSKPKEVQSPPVPSERKAHLEHNFQQLSILRFTRCDHCGDKMWGSQLRCTACPISIHVRCVAHLQAPCALQNSSGVRAESPPTPMPPSMFGRDLVEQVQADSRDDERQVPIIVEKCIDAVETLALDYEGIYRKSGGSGQTKAITQLFERGDYDSFDLEDSDRFNDICSVTSVLKNYFRALPVPLLTFDLHDEFMAAVHVRDQDARHSSLLDLVNKLPNEHYYTLRMLMLHLYRVREQSEKNLMTARNLGVVFGPTLMRSRDPGAEFSDMAGKALSVEWLVDNAPLIFDQDNSN